MTPMGVAGWGYRYLAATAVASATAIPMGVAGWGYRYLAGTSIASAIITGSIFQSFKFLSGIATATSGITGSIVQIWKIITGTTNSEASNTVVLHLQRTFENRGAVVVVNNKGQILFGD